MNRMTLCSTDGSVMPNHMVRWVLLLLAALVFASPSIAQIADAEIFSQEFPDSEVLGDPEAIRDALLQFSPQTGEDRLPGAGNVRALITLRPPTGVSPNDLEARRESMTIIEAALTGTDSVIVEIYKDLPIAQVDIDLAGLNALLAIPEVGGIEFDGKLETQLQSSRVAIGADVVNAEGIDGHDYGVPAPQSFSSDWIVAVLDTGTRLSHIALNGSTEYPHAASEACFTFGNLCPNGARAISGRDTSLPCTDDSRCSHGTHVAGIVTAQGLNGKPDGVAPRAGLYSIRVFDTGGVAYESSIISALEHVRSLVVDEGRRFASVNMSLGSAATYTGTCDGTGPAMKTAIDSLRNVGVLVVVSAGNDYESNRMSYPACISSAFSVGATTDSDSVADFSNLSSETDLHAPGVIVESTGTASDTDYYFSSGTSMAAPHVAAAAAALYSCVEGRTLAPAVPRASLDDAVAALLTNTGVAVPDNRGGGLHTKPRLDMLAAARSIHSNDAFAGASQLTGPNGARSQFLQCSSVEVDEPLERPNARGTLWYRWTAPENGTVFFDSCSALTSQAQMSLYSGPDLGSLTLEGTRSHSGPDCDFDDKPLEKKVLAGESLHLQFTANVLFGDFTIDWSFAALSDPFFTSPSISEALSGNTISLSWNDGGNDVDEWWIYAGSAAGGRQYVDSGSLGTSLETTITGLPSDGSDVHLTLWYRAESVWRSVQSTHAAASGGSPTFTSPENGAKLTSSSETIRWTDNGAGVTQWWLYAGTSPGSSDLFNSGSLGGAGSTNVLDLPLDGRIVHFTLWYRTGFAAWKSISTTYTAATISNPLLLVSPAPQSILSGSIEQIQWALSDPAVDVAEYWVYAGLTKGAADLYNSGSLGTATETYIKSLPVDGSEIHLTIWYRQTDQSSWTSINEVVFARQGRVAPRFIEPEFYINDEDFSGTEQFSWSAEGLEVEEWWVWFGGLTLLPSPVYDPDLYYDSGSLGTTTSAELPIPCVYDFEGPDPQFGATLWFRIGPHWDSTEALFSGTCNF